MAALVIYVRKTLVNGSTVLLEFRARELSARGAFVASDDLGLLDPDEEVEVLAGTAAGPFATAPARVTWSQRSFAGGRGLTASGYGLEFLAAGVAFGAAVDALIREAALPETGLEPVRSVRTRGF